MDQSAVGWQERYADPPTLVPADRTPTGGSFDMRAFVNRVADQFQETEHTVVDDSAREVLIQPALPHAESVAQALATGSLTMDFLESSLIQVLQEAQLIIGERRLPRIDEAAVLESMRRYCPYVFWC